MQKKEAFLRSEGVFCSFILYNYCLEPRWFTIRDSWVERTLELNSIVTGCFIDTLHNIIHVIHSFLIRFTNPFYFQIKMTKEMMKVMMSRLKTFSWIVRVVWCFFTSIHSANLHSQKITSSITITTIDCEVTTTL